MHVFKGSAELPMQVLRGGTAIQPVRRALAILRGNQTAQKIVRQCNSHLYFRPGPRSNEQLGGFRHVCQNSVRASCTRGMILCPRGNHEREVGSRDNTSAVSSPAMGRTLCWIALTQRLMSARQCDKRTAQCL